MITKISSKAVNQPLSLIINLLKLTYEKVRDCKSEICVVCALLNVMNTSHTFGGYMKQTLIFILTLFYSIASIAEDAQLAAIFDRYETEGTILISSIGGEKEFIYNESRAGQRFAVASTFKILNSLIALEEKIVLKKESIIKWDGTEYGIRSWNGDQTLASAYKVSCVWCYQRIAERIGAEKYRFYIDALGYGQISEVFNETTFWLDGSLKNSANEQVDFLKEVYRRSLPFSLSSYETLKDIMTEEESSLYVIRAKTGWAKRVEPQVGWYVGYVETKNDTWFFATNITINSIADLSLRKKITLEALRTKGII